ncbi:uncharacterized protein N7515_007387 [Penicillium bovifimosum]|uniref:Ubiquitin-like domain-containing protein n=1 Tax=Penicillium bovifimosum TaxID=126998 RepID=A0A9W9GWW4_9EURO|nr:uncharacterized protein N7515_007387 [Penicillium bovifimosum]KAJ5131348.1 hypothetical protein N7515_007387 [Penicillium bovifimosum]
MDSGQSSPQPVNDGDTPSLITLHLLCQSLPPPSRFTLDSVPLSITVGQLKERIERSFPGNPGASSQRLIYRGKVLSSNDAMLRAVVSSMETIASMHLVLPPEPANPEAPSIHSPEFSPSFASAPTVPSQTSSITGTGVGAFPAFRPSTSNLPGLNQNIPSSSSETQSTTANLSETDDTYFPRVVQSFRNIIEHVERQLDRNMPISMQHIVLIRTSIFEFQDILDARQLHLAEVSELIGRLLEAQQRTRTLLNTQPHLFQPEFIAQDRLFGSNGMNRTNAFTANSIYTSGGSGAQMFLLSSPTGQPHIVASGQAVPLPEVQPAVPYIPAATRTAGAPQPPDPHAAVVQNAIRQAMVNQQRQGDNIEHAGLARHIRRIWLFARLWFLCYLVSAPDTWRRWIFVGVALLVTFLSETDIPQQLVRLIITPLQRHLEGLTHAGGPADPAAQTRPNGPAARLDIWDSIRRVERSLVLLFASLVPGLGERQAQARTAAEQAFLAERERQARERLEQEQARERQGQEQTPQGQEPQQAPVHRE